MIASPGGYPKDINLYQTQKALDNAHYAVRPSGIIILAGACSEGYGEATFEEWLLTAEKPEDLIERVQKEFRLGGHKAAAIAMVLQDASVFLVSDLPEDQAARTFMTPFSDLDTAIQAALKRLGPDARIILMPYACSTLPDYVGP